MHSARARAHANIALAKYWGKIDAELNLPAVPSISLTLDALATDTTVTVDPSMPHDVIVLDGREESRERTGDAVALLERVRERSGVRACARVESANSFPTASGLASSASGFAALAVAAARAYGATLTPDEASAWARRCSASAARSVFGGWVELPAGVRGDDSLPARPIAGPSHWDVAMVIAIASHDRKKTPSRGGMMHTARTSPYYPAWLARAPILAHEVKSGILARDLERVGVAMEASTSAMHACAWAAVPSVRYLEARSIGLLAAVDELRASGLSAYATMDAGPHVKVLCEGRDAERVAAALRAGGALEVRVARPGADAA